MAFQKACACVNTVCANPLDPEGCLGACWWKALQRIICVVKPNMLCMHTSPVAPFLPCSFVVAPIVGMYDENSRASIKDGDSGLRRVLWHMAGGRKWNASGNFRWYMFISIYLFPCLFLGPFDPAWCPQPWRRDSISELGHCVWLAITFPQESMIQLMCSQQRQLPSSLVWGECTSHREGEARLTGALFRSRSFALSGSLRQSIMLSAPASLPICLRIKLSFCNSVFLVIFKTPFSFLTQRCPGASSCEPTASQALHYRANNCFPLITSSTTQAICWEHTLERRVICYHWHMSKRCSGNGDPRWSAAVGWGCARERCLRNGQRTSPQGCRIHACVSNGITVRPVQ